MKIFLIIVIIIAGFGSVIYQYSIFNNDDVVVESKSKSLETENDSDDVVKTSTPVLNNKISTETIDGEVVYTYTSNELGISFQFVEYAMISPDIKEIGNRIVFGENYGWIDVFEKNPAVSFEDAIKKTFLNGRDAKDCWVEMDESPSEAGGVNQYLSAKISFPVPENNQGDPWWVYGENCSKYADSTGVQYFLYNPLVPDKFIFVENGQGVIAFAPKQYKSHHYSYTIKIF